MANQLEDAAKKAAAADAGVPSDAEIKKQLEAEKKARLEAEQQREQFRAAAAYEWQRAEAAKTAKPADITDPVASFVADDALLDPEKRAQRLDAAIRARSREEIERQRREDEARHQMERHNDRVAAALEAFASSHPDMVQDAENFEACVVRANRRAQTQKLNLTPAGTLNLAAEIYNENVAKSSSKAPYTEGASAGAPRGANVNKEAEETPQSAAEVDYGAKDFIDERKTSIDDYTAKWLADRNHDLTTKEKFWSGIRTVLGTLEEGKKIRAASAGGR